MSRLGSSQIEQTLTACPIRAQHSAQPRSLTAIRGQPFPFHVKKPPSQRLRGFRLPSWPCEFDSRHPLHSKIPSRLALSAAPGPKMARRLRALGPLWTHLLEFTFDPELQRIRAIPPARRVTRTGCPARKAAPSTVRPPSRPADSSSSHPPAAQHAIGLSQKGRRAARTARTCGKPFVLRSVRH